MVWETFSVPSLQAQRNMPLFPWHILGSAINVLFPPIWHLKTTIPCRFNYYEPDLLIAVYKKPKI